MLSFGKIFLDRQCSFYHAVLCCRRVSICLSLRPSQAIIVSEPRIELIFDTEASFHLSHTV